MIPVSVAMRKRFFGDDFAVDHPLGREDAVFSLPNAMHLARTATHSRYDEELGVGRVGLPAGDVLRPDSAWTWHSRPSRCGACGR